MILKLFSRFEFIKNTIQDINGEILDVGSSQGFLHSRLFELNSDIMGLDINPVKFPNFLMADACTLPFKNDVFEVLIAGELIEHLTKPVDFLRECFEVMMKEGILIITTPNRCSWWNRITKSYHIEEHISLMNRDELTQILECLNFTINTTKYFPFDKWTSGLSMGLKHFYWLRKIIHKIMPDSLRENMVIVACKRSL